MATAIVQSQQTTLQLTKITSDQQAKLDEKEQVIVKLQSELAAKKQAPEEDRKVSAATVKVHLSAIFDTLDVTNRTEATLVMRELGLEQTSEE